MACSIFTLPQQGDSSSRLLSDMYLNDLKGEVYLGESFSVDFLILLYADDLIAFVDIVQE